MLLASPQVRLPLEPVPNPMNSPVDPASGHPHVIRNATTTIAEAVDTRMLVLMRCVLAFSAFSVEYFDVSDPQWTSLVILSLGGYCAYSVLLAIASRRTGWQQPHRVLHWVDMAFYTYLATLTGGAASIFFNFFLFAILVAAFTHGFREGMQLSLATMLAYTAIAIATTPPNVELELDHALIRVVYLFVFGSMISYWGGYESLLKLRLALLNEINNAWNPRLGVDRIIGSNLRRLLDFYEAETCVLVIRRPSSPSGCVMYRSLRGAPASPPQPIAMTAGASKPLLALPDPLAAFYHAPDGPWQQRWRGHDLRGAGAKEAAAECNKHFPALANLLDTTSFITVPYAGRDSAGGRLYLAGRRHGFAVSDIGFLTQAANAIATVVANTMLMEELILRASEQERRKISRDLHDSTIQPYIGLKLALDALLRDATADNPLVPRLRELAEMTGMTVRDLREYADSIKGKAGLPGHFLLGAIVRKTKSLRRFYGIDVQLNAALDVEPGEQAASEAFHIVSEGLSNILRHTHARKAFVRLRGGEGRLDIEIGNEAQDLVPDFMPLSIRDRVLTLGGDTVVDANTDGYTVVRISIPA